MKCTLLFEEAWSQALLLALTSEGDWNLSFPDRMQNLVLTPTKLIGNLSPLAIKRDLFKLIERGTHILSTKWDLLRLARPDHSVPHLCNTQSSRGDTTVLFFCIYSPLLSNVIFSMS